MGSRDIGLKAYLRDNARYADLWNGGIFQGKQIVRADGLRKSTEVMSGRIGYTVKQRTKKNLKRFIKILGNICISLGKKTAFSQ